MAEYKVATSKIRRSIVVSKREIVVPEDFGKWNGKVHYKPTVSAYYIVSVFALTVLLPFFIGFSLSGGFTYAVSYTHLTLPTN